MYLRHVIYKQRLKARLFTS